MNTIMNSAILTALCSVILLGDGTWADYPCLCNYDVEATVYPKPDEKESPLGYLYEFDCKLVLQDYAVSGWIAVAFEHKIGYILIGTNRETQVCAGAPYPGDILPSTTSSSPATTTSTTQTTTESTTLSISSALYSTEVTSTMSSTKLTSTMSTTESTSSTSTFTPNASTATTTNRLPISNPVVTGDISLCPAKLHQFTLEDQGALTQYGDYCYELVPIRGTWERAERDCIYKGGYLIHIYNQQLQNFIYNWIKSYKFDHACWIGLHDLWAEEQFEWISGDRVNYTNWYSDRYGNLASHHQEDCVLLVPYSPYFGKWDDVTCGQETSLGAMVGQTSPFICEFRIQSRLHGPIIG